MGLEVFTQGPRRGGRFVSFNRDGGMQFSAACTELFGVAQTAIPMIDRDAHLIGLRLGDGKGAIALRRAPGGAVVAGAKALAVAAGWRPIPGSRYPVAVVDEPGIPGIITVDLSGIARADNDA